MTKGLSKEEIREVEMIDKSIQRRWQINLTLKKRIIVSDRVDEI